MPRKSKKQIDADNEAVAEEEAIRWRNSLSLEDQVAIKRRSGLEFCLKFRDFLKLSTTTLSHDKLLMALKIAQRGLVKTRRLRETRIWPTEH